MDSSEIFSSTMRTWSDLATSHSMQALIRSIKASGLSMPQFSVLMRLHYRGPCEVADIGVQLGITAAAASQLVDRLVQCGLLNRVEDSHDRRVRQISLTESGQALVKQALETRNAWTAALTARLTRAQQSRIAAALTDLIEAARDLE